jgi:hypothetical protein
MCKFSLTAVFELFQATEQYWKILKSVATFCNSETVKKCTLMNGLEMIPINQTGFVPLFPKLAQISNLKSQ